MRREGIIMTVCLAAALCLIATGGTAQARYDIGNSASVGISDPILTLADDSVSIRMQISTEKVHIRKRHSVMLGFSLRNGDREAILPPVIYSGKLRHRFEVRTQVSEFGSPVNEPYLVYVGRKGKKMSPAARVIDYKATVPFGRWMADATLHVRYYQNDCCRERLLGENTVGGTLFTQEMLARIQIPVLVPDTVHIPVIADLPQEAVRPLRPDPALYPGMILFIEPQIRQVATQMEKVSIDLYFPRGRSVVDPLFDGNLTTLNRLDSLLYNLPRDGQYTITVTGYTSPEGAYFDNLALGKNRAQELRRYIRLRYPFIQDVIVCDWIGEDWDKLYGMISSERMAYWQQMLYIIDNVGIFDGREKKLMDLAGGWPYKQLLANQFPDLRRVEAVIRYQSAQGEAAIAEDISYPDPRKLSPDDIYALAAIYDKKDERYGRIYKKAAEIYPHNITINNNAAAACLIEGDVALARKYLDRIRGAPQTYVNLGVCSYMEGDVVTAVSLFNQAAKENEPQGERNLKLLEMND